MVVAGSFRVAVKDGAGSLTENSRGLKMRVAGGIGCFSYRRPDYFGAALLRNLFVKTHSGTLL
jgi:hypothetical protein